MANIKRPSYPHEVLFVLQNKIDSATCYTYYVRLDIAVLEL